MARERMHVFWTPVAIARASCKGLSTGWHASFGHLVLRSGSTDLVAEDVTLIRILGGDVN